MLNWIKTFEKSARQPVVLIGHSKHAFNDRGLHGFPARMKREDQVAFETMSQFVLTAALSGSFSS
jgi:hypothetical protein